MQENSKKKRSATIAAVIAIIGILVFIALFVGLLLGLDSIIASGFLLVYIGMLVLVIISIIVCLIQRYKEIDKNEIEEARKY